MHSRIIRIIQAVLYSLCALFLLLLAIGPAHAQTAAVPGPLQPNQVTIAGQRGDVETRLLTLRLPAQAQRVHFLPQDLSRADSAAVLPARQLSTSMLSITLPISDPITATLTVDLRGVPSGEYKGNLLLVYDGADHALPLTISVKDPPLWPALLLALGVALGIGLTFYRKNVQPRDGLLVDIGRVQAQVDADHELRPNAIGAPFRDRVAIHLTDAGTALRSDELSLAHTHLTRANRVLDVWRRERERWLLVLPEWKRERDESASELAAQRETPFARNVLTGLESAVDAAIDATAKELEKALGTSFSGARGLQADVQKLDRCVADFVQITQEIASVEQALKGVAEPEFSAWKSNLESFRTRLRAMLPVTDEDYPNQRRALRDEIQSAHKTITGLPKVVPAAPAAAAMPAGAPRPARQWALLSDLVTQSNLFFARLRLRIFAWASYVAAVILLAGTGFGELYVNKATFGAAWWSDYFGLLLWGFGAEATRAAVTEVVRGWGLLTPGTPANPPANPPAAP